jgi:type IV pilus assembly protein PilC
MKDGELGAPDEHALALLLREQNLLLTQAVPLGKTERASQRPFLKMDIGGVSALQKILFSRHLSVMLDAGLSLAHALRILAQQAGKKYFGQVLTDLHRRVEEGSTFCDALKQFPRVFPRMYISMVHLGETSGNLSLVLRELTVQMQKNYDLTRKIRGAMYYPIVILCTLIGVSIMLVTYVLPKLTKTFEELNADLPALTKALIAASKFLNQYWLWVLVGLAVLIVLFLLGAKTERGKSSLSSLGLKLPKIGDIVRKINLARFCRTFSSLLRSGIPIIDALKIVADTLGNVKYRQAVLTAAEEIKKGTSLSQAFSPYPKIFIPIVLQIMIVGEETGKLDEMLVKLAEFYESEVEQEMANISSVIEPILMLILGGGVALMAISIISPIYSLSGAIK